MKGKDEYFVNFTGFNKTMTGLNQKDLEFLETVLNQLGLGYKVAVVYKKSPRRVIKN